MTGAAHLLSLLLRALASSDYHADLSAYSLAELRDVARKHRLSGLLGARKILSLPPTLSAEFAADHALVMARHMIFEHRLREVATTFASKDVALIVLKGLAYNRSIYSGLGLRPTSDIDVLVRPQHRMTAMRSLHELGYRAKASSPGFDGTDFHEVTFERDGIEVDLHTALTPPHRSDLSADASVWSEAIPLAFDGFSSQQLSPIHTLIFHCIHMAMHHFEVQGIYLLDIHLLVAQVPAHLNLETAARKRRCWRAVQTTLALLRTWIPPTTPPPPAEPTPNRITRVANAFGKGAPLTRWQQILTKYEHFDSHPDQIRYTMAYARRLFRELRLGGVSVKERLGLPPT